MQQIKVTQHRVQVNFPKDLYQKVRRRAFEENSSISGLIREIVIKSLTASHKEGSVTNDRSWRRFMNRYIGIIKGAKGDSLSHDQWAHKTAVFHEK